MEVGCVPVVMAMESIMILRSACQSGLIVKPVAAVENVRAVMALGIDNKEL